jgi:hypothetical protein
LQYHRRFLQAGEPTGKGPCLENDNSSRGPHSIVFHRPLPCPVFSALLAEFPLLTLLISINRKLFPFSAVASRDNGRNGFP